MLLVEDSYSTVQCIGREPPDKSNGKSKIDVFLNLIAFDSLLKDL